MAENFGPSGIWYCKIGSADVALPNGADSPMRDAVEQAFRDLTGQENDFCFSGWRSELTESEEAVINNRPLNWYRKLEQLKAEVAQCEEVIAAIDAGIVGK